MKSQEKLLERFLKICVDKRVVIWSKLSEHVLKNHIPEEGVWTFSHLNHIPVRDDVWAIPYDDNYAISNGHSNDVRSILILQQCWCEPLKSIFLDKVGDKSLFRHWGIGIHMVSEW